MRRITIDQFLNEGWKTSPIRNQIVFKMPNIFKSFTILETDDIIDLNLIVLKPEARRKGYFDQIMQMLIEYSNKQNKPILVTPDPDFGTPMKDLLNIYGKYGFKIDSYPGYEEETVMIRKPNK